MIYINKKLMLPVIAILFVVTFLIAGMFTYAQSQSGDFPTIVQKLAQKFGLKESDVQAVFDEHRTEKQTQMQAEFEEWLTKAVKDGKITEAQKQAVFAKHKELQEKRLSVWQNLKDMTPEERREASQTQRQELESWAEQQGIDIKYLSGFGGFKGHFHGTRNHMFWK